MRSGEPAAAPRSIDITENSADPERNQHVGPEPGWLVAVLAFQSDGTAKRGCQEEAKKYVEDGRRRHATRLTQRRQSHAAFTRG